jgi:hypothetical protein
MNFIPHYENNQKSREKSCAGSTSYFIREPGEIRVSGAIMPIVKFQLVENVETICAVHLQGRRQYTPSI